MSSFVISISFNQGILSIYTEASLESDWKLEPISHTSTQLQHQLPRV